MGAVFSNRLDGIRNQVEHDLCELTRVSHNERTGRTQVHRQTDPVQPELVFSQFDGLLDNLVQIQSFLLGFSRPRDAQDVLNDSGTTLRLGDDSLEVLLITLARLGKQLRKSFLAAP